MSRNEEIKYYEITPPYGRDAATGHTIFRTIDGVPYIWVSKTKTWEFKPSLTGFFHGSDYGADEITAEQAAKFIGD